MTRQTVFLSFSQADKSWADHMGKTLEALDVAVLSSEQLGIHPGELILAGLKNAIFNATVVFALVGPRTRYSKWVNTELEYCSRRTSEGPPPGLVVVILPDHDDFRRPFYEPESVPVRADDQVSRGSAILRKWSEKPEDVREWIAEASRRRRRFPASSISFAKESELLAFDWDPSAD